MSTLVEKLERESDRLHKLSVDFSHDTRLRLINEALGIYRAIDIVKKHQVESEWISVDERLPSDWSVVLCYGVPFEWDKTSKPNSNIFCAVYVAEHDRWSVGYSAFGDTSTQKVTHWQPLPQPPSEVKP